MLYVKIKHIAYFLSLQHILKHMGEDEAGLYPRVEYGRRSMLLLVFTDLKLLRLRVHRNIEKFLFSDDCGQECPDVVWSMSCVRYQACFLIHVKSIVILDMYLLQLTRNTFADRDVQAQEDQ